MAPSFNTEELRLLHALQNGENPLQALTWARYETSVGADRAGKVWQFAQSQTDARRQAGAYYTDAHTAADVARRAMRSMSGPPHRILEPSCGGGALVAAILTEGPQQWGVDAQVLAHKIHAWDMDPAGIFLAQWRIEDSFGDAVAAAISWRTGDTLAQVPEAPFDWIFGNPPFGNAIGRATRRSKKERARYARAFPLAARGAFDKCALFIEWATQQLSPGGRITYILPRSWLAQPASTHLRKALAQRFHLQTLAHLPDDTFFDASVATIALTLADTPNTPSLDTRIITQDGHETLLDAQALLQEGNWGAALHPFASILTRAQPTLRSIDTCAEFSAGATTAEAYAWKTAIEDTPQHRVHALGSGVSQVASPLPSKAEAVQDRAPLNTSSGAHRAFVIAGRIDPFTHTWGEVPTRYLGEDYDRPTLALSALSARRQAVHARPRALLPTLSVALEAAVDLDQECIGAVSTICAWPAAEASSVSSDERGAVLVLAAVLNSAWCRLQYSCLFSSLALQGGNTQVSKNKLRTLHIPAPWHTLICDAPSRAMAQHHASVARALRAEDLPTLDKKLPTLDRWWVLCASAERLRNALDVSVLREHLMHLLYTDPHTGLRAAWLDVLLLSLASSFVARIESQQSVD